MPTYCELMLCFLSRLLNVCSHVLEETTPGPPVTKPSLPSLPNAPSLSPIKRKAKAAAAARDDNSSSAAAGNAQTGGDTKHTSKSQQKGNTYTTSRSIGFIFKF